MFRFMVTVAAVALTVTSVSGFYEKYAQELLAFTGGAHAKVIWRRLKPMQADYCGAWEPNKFCPIVAMDTREGGARILDSVPGGSSNQSSLRFTRDGNYVIWHNARYVDTISSMIIKWDGTGKKKLIDGKVAGNPGFVCSVQWDAAARQQYVYALRPNSSGNTSVYRIPLNGDAVDLSKKVLVYNKTKVDYGYFPVSSNGKYAALCSPWPSVGRYNLQTQVLDIVAGPDPWACMPSIAPDTSGWVAHSDDSHTRIATISLDKKTRNWINAAMTMPGNRGKYDCQTPAWSNHARFMTYTYPLSCSYSGGVSTRALGEFCMGKYNATYSTIEWLCVTDTADYTYGEGFGDLWLENGETPGVTGTVRPEAGWDRASTEWLSVHPFATGFLLKVQGTGAHSVKVLSASGRLLRTMQGHGDRTYVLAARDLPPGLCMVVAGDETAWTTRTILVR